MRGEQASHGPGPVVPRATSDLTVVIPVHARIRSEELAIALGSIVRQTRPPDAIVVVLDGPPSPGVEAAIAEACRGFPVTVIKSAEQRGAGPARQAGLMAAGTTWVAFADADDESLPERFAKQLDLAETHDLDIVSGAMDEVDAGTGVHLGFRRFPSEHQKIVAAMRWRNVINQPAAMVRRVSALNAGGYRALPLLEDYDLWVRMLGIGARAANHPDVLVRFRGGMQSQLRRRRRDARRSEWQLQRVMLNSGVTTPWVAAVAWSARTTYRLIPRSWIPWLYKRLLLAPAEPSQGERPWYDEFNDMSEIRGPIAELLAHQVVETTKPFLSRPLSEIDVLDVGSGYGHTALALSRVCRKVCGLEPARFLHEAALGLAAQADCPGNLEFVNEGIESFSPAATFDLVVLDNVYEHLPDQATAMKAISRLLAPGGVLFLVCPNKLWPIEAHYRLFGLAWMPLRVANGYLRITGRGTSYEDASYSPTYWSLRRQLLRDQSISFDFVVPGDPAGTLMGSPWHYRLGMNLLGRAHFLWAISKSFVVVAVKSPLMDQTTRTDTHRKLAPGE